MAILILALNLLWIFDDQIFVKIEILEILAHFTTIVYCVTIKLGSQTYQVCVQMCVKHGLRGHIVNPLLMPNKTKFGSEFSFSSILQNVSTSFFCKRLPLGSH